MCRNFRKAVLSQSDQSDSSFHFFFFLDLNEISSLVSVGIASIFFSFSSDLIHEVLKAVRTISGEFTKVYRNPVTYFVRKIHICSVTLLVFVTVEAREIILPCWTFSLRCQMSLLSHGAFQEPPDSVLTLCNPSSAELSGIPSSAPEEHAFYVYTWHPLFIMCFPFA